MPSTEGIDHLLDSLLAASEALRDSARVFSVEDVSKRLTQRQDMVAVLQGHALSHEQTDRLRRAVAIGEEACQALLVKREMTRTELQETSSGRQLSEQFQPYQPKRSGLLNIRL